MGRRCRGCVLRAATFPKKLFVGLGVVFVALIGIGLTFCFESTAFMLVGSLLVGGGRWMYRSERRTLSNLRSDEKRARIIPRVWVKLSAYSMRGLVASIVAFATGAAFLAIGAATLTDCF